MSPALLKIRRELAAQLAEGIAKETGIPAEDILGRGRDAQVVAARHRLWAMLHDAGISYSSLGKVLDRDHTTVLYAVRKVREAQREFHSAERDRGAA